MITPHPRSDPYGKLFIEGRAGLFSPARVRQLRSNNKNFVKTPSNGLYDPMTYYHLVDFLLQLPHGETWDSKDLTEALNLYKPQYNWDTRTVGRILGDLWESLDMASPPGQCPVSRVNHSHHIYYAIQRFPHTATMLLDTLLDLSAVIKGGNVTHEDLKATAQSPLEFVAWLNPPV